MESKPVWTVDPAAELAEVLAAVQKLAVAVAAFHAALLAEGVDAETARYLTGVWLQRWLNGVQA